jgi:hypothetical protein
MSLEGEIRKLKGQLQQQGKGGDDHERKDRLSAIREAAERENERFLEVRATERRMAFLESVGYEGHAAEDLRDENYLYGDDDEPPFEIAEDGRVFARRDGKEITDPHQTLAEIWFWEFRESGYNPRGLIYDEEREAYLMPDPPHELAFSRKQCHLARYFWGALGDDRANPYY